jgi:hypothetical protein
MVGYMRAFLILRVWSLEFGEQVFLMFLERLFTFIKMCAMLYQKRLFTSSQEKLTAKRLWGYINPTGGPRRLAIQFSLAFPVEIGGANENIGISDAGYRGNQNETNNHQPTGGQYYRREVQIPNHQGKTLVRTLLDISKPNWQRLL